MAATPMRMWRGRQWQQVEPLERRVLLSAGDLDRGFDGNGLAATGFPAPWNGAEAVIALPGGKSLVGTAEGAGYRIARFNANGTLDRTFGGDGRVMGYGRTAMTIAPDGKILVAGPGMGVTRYNADGTLDVAFGRGGSDGNGVATATPDPLSAATSLAILPDGKLLLFGLWNLGQISPGSNFYDLSLVRYLPDGTLDATFGTYGVARSQRIGGVFKVLSSSKVLGYGALDEQRHGVFRLNADLSVDTTFGGGDGIASEAWDPSVRVSSIDAGPDGILLTGTERTPDFIETGFTVRRFTADGSPDTSFGAGDGRVTVPITWDDWRDPAVAVTPDGRVMLAGPGATTLRYTAAGTLDRAFGRGGPDGDGRVTVNFRGADDAVAAAAVTSTGAVWLAGRTSNSAGGTDLAVARLTADGVTDASFSDDGTAETRFPADAYARAVLVQPDGKTLVAGGADSAFAMARYSVDGTLDPSFGAGGFDGGGRVVSSDLSGSDAGGIALLPGGKVLAVVGGITAVRYNADGSRDTTFAPVPVADEAAARVLVPLRDGKFLVGGTYYVARGTIPTVLVARLNGDGTLDTTFGTGGSTTAYSFPGLGYVQHAAAVAEGADGKIVVVSPANGDTAFAILRYSSDGLLDTSFGTGGLALIDVDPASGQECPEAVAVLPGGAVVVAGRAGASGVLARLTPAGTLDRTFNSGRGYLTSPGDTFNALLPSSAGRLVVAGESAGGDFLLARYNSDGTADRSFRSGNYRALANFSGRDSAAALAVAPDGRIVAVGSTSLPGEGSKFAVARFRGAAGEDLSLTYQAEDAVLSGPVVSRSNGGYTGVGYADYRRASGDSVWFTIDVPSGGTYALGFRYANGGTFDRPLDLSVDGRVVGRLAFEPTGSWRTWNSATRSVFLTAGRHAVRLAATGRSGPNVDALAVTAVAGQ